MVRKDNFPNFICYKCGYHYYGEGHICPRCLTNNKFPKCRLILFIFCILFIGSVPFVKALPLLIISILGIIVSLPFAIREAIKSTPKVKDGLKIPETPNEIIEEQVRVPDLIKLNYIDGLTFSYDIKNILFDVTDSKLILYIDRNKDTFEIAYDTLADLEILTDTELKYSVSKGLISGTLLGVALGGVAGVAGYALGGLQAKDVYALKFSLSTDKRERALVVGGKKSDVEKLYRKIMSKK